MSGVVFSVYFTYMWHWCSSFLQRVGENVPMVSTFFFINFAQLDTWQKNVVGAVSVRDEEYHYDLD